MDRKPPPYRTFLASDSAIRELLRSHRTIAAFGADEAATSTTLRGLKQRGYRVVPLAADEGGAVAPALAALDVPPEIVLVFAAPSDLRPAVDAAADAGAAAVWFEPGVDAAHAAHRASRRGLTAVLGRSILAEYEMHFPDDELGID